MVSHLSYLA